MSRKNSTEDDESLETYVVQDGDTLNKIAAMHDTIPTKLAQVNRMFGSKYVFPGQVLKLPAPEPPKPPTPEPVLEKDVVDIKNEFLRVNVKHITENKGIVDGTLMLTSKIVMFDPYSHHPLVSESGTDAYQVIIPRNLVVNAVLLNQYSKNSDEDESLIYYKKVEDVKESGDGREDENDEEKENETKNEQTPTKGETVMYYLRLRMGQPIGSKIKRDEVILTYGENSLLPEYWFIVTPERAGDVFDLFQEFSKDFRIYGTLDVEAIEKHGLELVREGRSAIEAEPGKTVSRATVAKLDKSHLAFNSVDFSLIAPMIGTSELMSKEERIWLSNRMPQKLEMHTWVLAFSTSAHGFSLKNMTRTLSNQSGSSLLLVLSDLKQNVFGAFLSGIPNSSEHFEGTGETFLFKLRPDIKDFKWTGENNYFYKVDKESLIVGSSKGKFGLWVDRDLNNGRSQACATFDNEPLAGDSEEFTLKTLECWTFDMM